MNLSIVGYGAIGKLIEAGAKEKGIHISSIIDPFAPGATHKEFNAESMESVDVCICFTQPDVALQNIESACHWKKPLVMGTTGWTEALPQVRKQVTESGIGMVYSSNFSLGVNLFFHILEQACKVINRFDEYDILGYELHHNRKLDSPSGTAKTIEKIVLDSVDRKKAVVEDKLDRKIEPNEFHFASVRGGDIPGTHVISLDSKVDSIELKHTARNRNGFAMGSLVAAEWIRDKQGLYTEKDMMQQLLS